MTCYIHTFGQSFAAHTSPVYGGEKKRPFMINKSIIKLIRDCKAVGYSNVVIHK